MSEQQILEALQRLESSVNRIEEKIEEHMPLDRDVKEILKILKDINKRLK